jgi:hypothetical protein
MSESLAKNGPVSGKRPGLASPLGRHLIVATPVLAKLTRASIYRGPWPSPRTWIGTGPSIKRICETHTVDSLKEVALTRSVNQHLMVGSWKKQTDEEMVIVESPQTGDYHIIAGAKVSTALENVLEAAVPDYAEVREPGPATDDYMRNARATLERLPRNAIDDLVRALEKGSDRLHPKKKNKAGAAATGRGSGEKRRRESKSKRKSKKRARKHESMEEEDTGNIESGEEPESEPEPATPPPPPPPPIAAVKADDSSSDSDDDDDIMVDVCSMTNVVPHHPALPLGNTVAAAATEVADLMEIVAEDAHVTLPPPPPVPEALMRASATLKAKAHAMVTEPTQCEPEIRAAARHGYLLHPLYPLGLATLRYLAAVIAQTRLVDATDIKFASAIVAKMGNAMDYVAARAVVPPVCLDEALIVKHVLAVHRDAFLRMVSRVRNGEAPDAMCIGCEHTLTFEVPRKEEQRCLYCQYHDSLLVYLQTI